MSKALERVQSALKADQQRHQQRQRGGKVPTQELSLLDDVELPKKHRFRDLVLRILTVNRSLKLGIQRSNLKEWHELSKFRPASEEDHKVFMANVLNNFQLMARFSRFLRQAHDHAFKAEEEFFATGRPIDSEEFLKMIAIKLHEAKVSTAHLCWHEFVKPLRVHRVNLEAGVESLKTQLRQLRSEYLKEISTLRDSQRHRQDPLEGLADLRYFYEPLHSLEPTEQEFMVNLIREVLRMMMDSTDGKQKISSSVLERFVSEVHENEVKALKDEVTQKNWQLKQMKQAQNFLETQLLKNTQSPNERTAGSLEKMLQVTEEQLSHVRGAFYDLQKEEHRLRELCESSTAEQKEMAERLEQEMSENGLLQSEIARLCSVEEDQKQMIQSLETEHIELKETIKEQQVRLERTLARLMRRAANAEAAASHCESGAAAGAVEGAVEGAVRPAPASPSSVRRPSATGLNPLGAAPVELEDTDWPSSDHKLRGAEEKADMDGAARVDVQERCTQLEKLLREHCVQLSLLPAQQMQEEANQLITTAESLGCQVEAVNAQVRLCRCGNVLMDDARFCRKCGGQWTPGEAGGASSQQLAAEVSSLRMKIQESEQVLREFTKESGASTGTESSFTMSRIFRPKDGAMLQVEEISQEELQQRDELLRQRRHLEELKQGKLLAEAKLLAQRCMDLSKESGVDVMAALDEEALTCFGCDGVNCQYRRQVEVLQEMVKTLRGLCGQLSERLQQATGEHLQMSMALTSMQGSLEAAAQAVEQTSQEVDWAVDSVSGGETGGSTGGSGGVTLAEAKAQLKRVLRQVTTSLQETKRRSVFWRLYQNNGATHRRKSEMQEKRAALLNKTYAHLYKLDPAADLGPSLTAPPPVQAEVPRAPPVLAPAAPAHNPRARSFSLQPTHPSAEKPLSGAVPSSLPVIDRHHSKNAAPLSARALAPVVRVEFGDEMAPPATSLGAAVPRVAGAVFSPKKTSARRPSKR
ncbi:unnamed protein product, partial [Durusdinium trenchii]